MSTKEGRRWQKLFKKNSPFFFLFNPHISSSTYVNLSVGHTHALYAAAAAAATWPFPWRARGNGQSLPPGRRPSSPPRMNNQRWPPRRLLFVLGTRVPSTHRLLCWAYYYSLLHGKNGLDGSHDLLPSLYNHLCVSFFLLFFFLSHHTVQGHALIR